MSKTIALAYGIGEGRWHGKLIHKHLEAAGFTVTADLWQADIILSHSAGCFFLPRPAPSETIVLIGPPYWPGKPLIVSVFQKIHRDLKDHIARRKLGFWLKKLVGTLYTSLNMSGGAFKSATLRASTIFMRLWQKIGLSSFVTMMTPGVLRV